MAIEVNKFQWIFNKEVEVPNDVEELLIEGEVALKAYKTVRDVAIITNKRFIIKDKQGITGKKIEIYSVPFNQINMYSTENAGTIDLSSEIELWTRSGHIKIKLGRGVDVRYIDKVIAEAIL